MTNTNTAVRIGLWGALPPLIAVAAFAAAAGSTAAEFLAILSIGLAVATSAAAVGAFVGFLFGVPRRATDSTQPDLVYEPNTSLEQISDWLTKIIVGVTLVQLGDIARGLGRLFGVLATSLGDAPGSAVFLGALTTYCAVAGFAGGWLLTRLYLSPALRGADQLLARAAEEAEARGQTDQADTLRQAAAILTPADQFHVIRSSAPPSPRRTREQDALYQSVRTTGIHTKPSRDHVRELFGSGADGDRVMALALMEGNLEEAADTELVADAITQSRSAFEQYHALRLARLLLTRGDRADADVEALRSAAEDALGGPRQSLLDGERRRLAEEVLRLAGAADA